MAAYRRVYDTRHLQADCQEQGSAPGPYTRQSSTGYLYLFNLILTNSGSANGQTAAKWLLLSGSASSS